MATTPLVLATFAFLSVVSMGQVALRIQQREQTKRSMGLVLDRYTEDAVLTPVSTNRDQVYAAWLASIAERFMTQRGVERLRRQLAFAGRPEHSAFVKALRNKILGAVALGLFGIWLGIMLSGWAWIGVPLGILGGFWLPDVLIANAAIKRTEGIARDLPDAIELLNLCVESGMGFQAALAHVAKTQQGAAAEEFSRVLREMQLGQSRQEALRGLGQRTRQIDLLRLIHAILQADDLGIAISGVLNEQAAEMRAKRRDRARETAQKVPVKILMPVILCFLPGIFIIVLGPAAVSLVRVFAQMS
jgi:tight adherence protein C